MSKVKRWVGNSTAGDVAGYHFWCPACQEIHSLCTEKPAVSNRACWGYNDNEAAPTFTPSVLLRSGHHAPGWKPGDGCWCTYNREHPAKPAPFACTVCHSFVRDGQIQFLGDCTHALAGQTVALPDWESRNAR